MNLRTGLRILYVAAALPVAIVTTPAVAQRGVATDWSSHHVIFNNPGSEMDALMNGRRQDWQNYVNNPRYRAQQIKRSVAWANRLGNATADHQAVLDSRKDANDSPTGDWTYQIAPADSGFGTARGMYPAEFANDPTTANCADYVVFPVNTAGKSGTGNGQANVVAFNNLYAGTCKTGGVPSIKFSYYVGAGSVLTSTVTSLDGTKVAFVESVNGGRGSNFHVLTLDTSGKGNGTAYNSPAVPKTIIDNGATVTTAATNNAVDRYVTINGAVNDTRSSPYIDYSHDAAFIGDDSGSLHKFTGVFNGIVAEVTSGGWPIRVSSGNMLTGAILDPQTENIFVAAADGKLYCFVSINAQPCARASIEVSNGSFASEAVIEAPIVVDNGASSGVTGWVFDEAEAINFGSSASVLMQADTNLSSVTRLNLGSGGMDLYSGDFNNAFYNSGVSTGYTGAHMYFCGTGLYKEGNSIEPTLYQISFNTGTGAITSSLEGPLLVQFGFSGSNYGCSPLMEVFNGTTDYLFLGVRGEGKPGVCVVHNKSDKTPEACIMSFDLGQTFSSEISPVAGLPLGGNTNGSSGMVIDNTSTQPGASQIYFSNLETSAATQASQATIR